MIGAALNCPIGAQGWSLATGLAAVVSCEWSGEVRTKWGRASSLQADGYRGEVVSRRIQMVMRRDYVAESQDQGTRFHSNNANGSQDIVCRGGGQQRGVEFRQARLPHATHARLAWR